ncbi:ankyrin repeat-containing domain protein [Lasiosphaeria hispida]|uniref:Ankyrin repeat-containing domain protein n=1 Tax=Lasiosphaeria hispida TaxID=260671 RepID=A0AAJ0MAA3_9PEZI|nr:ankyrin repeat-containing domain protein [Lasiosphaeria hispida]
MAKDWAPVHDEVHRLYVEQNQPLTEVMRLVKGKFGFIASERSYRTQLAKWGYTKYSTQAAPKSMKTSGPPKNQPRRARQQAVSMTALRSPSINQTGIPSVNDMVPASFPQFGGNGHGSFFGVSDAAPIGNYQTHMQLSNMGGHIPVTNAFGHDGKTPLHHAVIARRVDLVKSLLHDGAPVNTKDYVGNHPLHYAAIASDPEIVDLLIRFGSEVDARGQHGLSALHLATTGENLRVVNILVNGGADVCTQDDGGNAPLHLALAALASNCNLIVDALIAGKADLNQENGAGVTPFLALLDRPYQPESILEYVPVFLNGGASATKPLTSGKTPLQIFLFRCPSKWSLAAGGRYHIERDSGRRCNRALHCLLDKGASPDTPMQSGVPLVVSFFRCHYMDCKTDRSLAERLVELSSVDSVFCDGGTLLHELVGYYRPPSRNQRGITGLLKSLLERGANPNHQNHNGETPLMALLADRINDFRDKKAILEVAEVLLNHGADPLQGDAKGRQVIFQPRLSSNHSDTSPLLLRRILWACIRIIKAKQGHQIVAERRWETDENKWWMEWQKAARMLQEVEWDKLDPPIREQLGSPDERCQEESKKVAYGVLAESQLQVYEDRTRSALGKNEEHRRMTACILRDCRAHGVPVDIMYFDLLLELC